MPESVPRPEVFPDTRTVERLPCVPRHPSPEFVVMGAPDEIVGELDRLEVC
jgi:hypothetical protein